MIDKVKLQQLLIEGKIFDALKLYAGGDHIKSNMIFKTLYKIVNLLDTRIGKFLYIYDIRDKELKKFINENKRYFRNNNQQIIIAENTICVPINSEFYFLLKAYNFDIVNVICAYKDKQNKFKK